MSYLEKLDRLIQEQKEQEKREEESTPQSFEDISLLRLSEFEKRDLAVEIYSEVLGINLWLCSNDEMAAQVKRDATGAVCYTVQELRNLLRLNPSPESLKKIHEAKAVFPGSTVIGAETKEGVLDQCVESLDTSFGIELFAWLDTEEGRPYYARISAYERIITEYYNAGTIEELRASLKEYHRLHEEAEKMRRELEK